jgi:hypothetical protein
MPSSPFTSGGFFVDGVTLINPRCVRLHFTFDPLQVSALGVHDALNAANYSLTGPTAKTVSACTTVAADPQSIDIFVADDLEAGSWTVTAATAIQTSGGTSLSSPRTGTFTVDAVPAQEPLSGGATAEDAETRLRQYLNPALKGRGWDALLAAFAVGDQYKQDLGAAAFDQLFKSSASGVFLDRRASDDGVTRPESVGLSDDDFRKIAIKTTARKQIVQVIQETLEVFYGPVATRAHATTTVAAPYALTDGDTLALQLDGKVVNIVFKSADFASIAAAKSVEVAAVITRHLRSIGSSAYALAFDDPSDGQSYVQVFSGALGLRGSVVVIGGRAQNALLFPTAVHSLATGPQAGTVLSIVVGTTINGVASGRVRFTYSSGANPSFQDVLPGDYLVAYGSSISSGLRNTYAVVASDVTYVEIATTSSWPASMTLVNAMDMRFYRPTVQTIQSLGRMATATQGDPSVLDIIMPATTDAVSRTPETAAYLHAGTALPIVSASRSAAGVVSVQATAHGLAIGQQIQIDGLAADNTVGAAPAWINADTGNVAPAIVGMAMTKLAADSALQCGGGDINPPVTGNTRALWRLNEASGTATAADAGGTYPLTSVTGTPTAVSGQFGNGRNFAGTSYVSGAADAATVTKIKAGGYTIRFWMWINSLSGHQGVFGLGNADHSAWVLYAKLWNASGTMYLGSSSVGNGGAGGSAYPTGQWMHVVHAVATTSGGAQVKETWINGVSRGTWSAGAPTDTISTPTWFIGASEGGAGFTNADVRLDEVEFINTQWVQADVNTDFALGPYNSINASYKFNANANTWTATPNMLSTRTGHTLTTLSSGKVLAAGGGVNTSELYDPNSNTWTSTGNMGATRIFHAATGLADGRVFVVGGGAASAEIYNPATGSWTATAAPSVDHVNGTATLLVDGRVLVAGGGTTVCEVYNPANNTWKTATAMPSAISSHRAALLPSGKVLLVGGTTDGATGVASTRLFDPSKMLSVAGPLMNTQRVFFALTSLPNGTLLAAGGQRSVGTYTNTAEIYDPFENTWTSTANLAVLRYSAVGVPLTNGVLLNGVSSLAAYPTRYSTQTSVIAAGGLNGIFAVTSVADANHFTYNTTDFLAATTALVTDAFVTPTAAGSNAISGPYIYDEAHGVAITGTATTTSQILNQGQGYAVVSVADASAFPDAEGYLVFGFGTDDQLGPVRYLGRISSTALLVDASQSFERTLAAGTSVTLLVQRGAWTPTESSGSFYITGSTSGRVAASNTINSLVAAGVNVRTTITYPSDIGLGNEGQAASGVTKVSDKVSVWGGDEVDAEIAEARDE